MPIVDGLSSTKMIRSFEKTHFQSNLSPRASGNGRVPIFAVSASLVERNINTYISAGFDGWVLKPIDFKRLNTLLNGIVDDEVRNTCVYQPGHWERGGWFQRRQPSIIRTSTFPSGSSPVQHPPQAGIEPRQPDEDTSDNNEYDGSSKSFHSGSTSSGNSGTTITSVNYSDRPLIHDDRLDSLKQDGEVDDLPAKDRPTEDVTDQPGL